MINCNIINITNDIQTIIIYKIIIICQIEFKPHKLPGRG